jgi:hypothetical protein
MLTNVCIFSVCEDNVKDLQKHHAAINFLKDCGVPYSMTVLRAEATQAPLIALMVASGYVELVEHVCQKYGRAWYIKVDMSGVSFWRSVQTGHSRAVGGLVRPAFSKGNEDSWVWVESVDQYYVLGFK